MHEYILLIKLKFWVSLDQLILNSAWQQVYLVVDFDSFPFCARAKQ